MVPGSIFSNWSLAKQHRSELLADADMLRLAQAAQASAAPRRRRSLRAPLEAAVLGLLSAITAVLQPKPVAPRGFRDGLW